MKTCKKCKDCFHYEPCVDMLRYLEIVNPEVMLDTSEVIPETCNYYISKDDIVIKSQKIEIDQEILEDFPRFDGFIKERYPDPGPEFVANDVILEYLEWYQKDKEAGAEN